MYGVRTYLLPLSLVTNNFRTWVISETLNVPIYICIYVYRASGVSRMDESFALIWGTFKNLTSRYSEVKKIQLKEEIFYEGAGGRS